MKAIMILGGSYTQIPFINICKRKGYKTIVTDKFKNAYAFKFADIAICVDAVNKEEILNYAIKYNIVGILTKTEALLPTVAYVCEKLNLIGLSNKAAMVSNDKFLLREYMQKAGMKTPENWVVTSLEDIENIKFKFNYPLVIKPVDSAGSEGVIKVQNEVELLQKFNFSMSFSLTGKVMIEAFLEGKECGVETITQNGITNIIGITEKNVQGSPYFVETMHMIPGEYSKDILHSIEDTAKQLLDIIDVKDGISHIDMMITKEGPIVIETGTRMGGDYICTDLIPLSTGIDMYENLINIVTGTKINIIPKFNKYSAIKFITSFNYDNVLKQHNYIINDSNYVRHEFYNRTKSGKLSNSSERLGYYIFTSHSRRSLNESLKLIND